MIATRLHQGQGLGNQLWCYASCRSIANELKMPFMILGQENFKAAKFLNIDFSSKGVGASGTDYGFNLFHEQRFYDKEMDYIASCYDDRVEKLPIKTEIEGLFQSEKYFYGDLNKIQEYVRIKDEYRNLVNVAVGSCTLNIRGGEYKRHKRFILPKSYWLNAMSNMREMYGIHKFQIVTDDYKYARALFPEIEIIPEGVAESYVALHNSSHLIVSNSTFSYFPIKTKATIPIVIAPKYFARFNDHLNRWASPANIYKDWLWQDRDGELQTYEECINEANHIEERYFSSYYIGVPLPPSGLKKISSMIPSIIKRMLKKILSTLFPLKYG